MKKEKDRDFDKVVEIMKSEFQWRGEEVGKQIFTYTNDLIKATKIALSRGNNSTSNEIKRTTINKYEFRVLKSGNTDYPINVQVWTDINGGKSYCGVGKFCKTMEEANEYIDNYYQN